MILRIASLLFTVLITYACSSQRRPLVPWLLPLQVPERFLHTAKDSMPSNSAQTTKLSPGAADEGAGEESYVTLIFCS